MPLSTQHRLLSLYLISLACHMRPSDVLAEYLLMHLLVYLRHREKHLNLCICIMRLACFKAPVLDPCSSSNIPFLVSTKKFKGENGEQFVVAIRDGGLFLLYVVY